MVVFITSADCEKAMLDVVLILDQSSSLVTGQPNYNNWDVHMLGFAASLVRSFPISPTLTQIGLMKYSDEPDIVFHLNNYTEAESILEMLQTLDIDGGDTNIAGALEAARIKMFVEERGARLEQEVRRVLFLVTDGTANINVSRTQTEAKLAKDTGIEIYTIGVTSRVSQRQLEMIASYPPEMHFYYVPDFFMLENVVHDLAQSACLSVHSTTTTTTTATTPTTTTTATPTTTTTPMTGR